PHRRGLSLLVMGGPILQEIPEFLERKPVAWTALRAPSGGGSSGRMPGREIGRARVSSLPEAPDAAAARARGALLPRPRLEARPAVHGQRGGRRRCLAGPLPLAAPASAVPRRGPFAARLPRLPGAHPCRARGP